MGDSIMCQVVVVVVIVTVGFEDDGGGFARFIRHLPRKQTVGTYQPRRAHTKVEI